MARTIENPLSLDEMRDIRTTILAMEAEIHNPGAAAYRGHRDFLADIEDALRRLADAIERDERIAVETNETSNSYVSDNGQFGVGA